MQIMRNILGVIFIAFAVFACQSAKDEYTIKGTIAGVEKGKVYLIKVVEGMPQTVDSTEVAAGKFTFKGKMETPDLRVLRLNDRDYFAQFFLDNSKINVAAQKDSLAKTKITGSPTQDIFQNFINEMERVGKEVNALQDKYRKAMQTGNTEVADNAKIDYQALMDNNMVYTKNFVKQHPNSVVAAYITLAQLAPQIDASELDSIVSKFAPELDKSEYVKQLKELVEKNKNTAIGALAPDFTLNTPDGKPFQLSSLKGKVVLLDFWASWCGPCRQENPNVVKLYQQYHSKGLEIVGVSLDKTKEDWEQAIKDDKLDWTHVSELQYWNSEVAKLYSVNAIPQSFLLDKDGKIIAKGEEIRGEGLAKKLAELFPN